MLIDQALVDTNGELDDQHGDEWALRDMDFEKGP
jgi:hypothetical protein